MEYLCSGEYSPGSEAGISPLAHDIDWSMCDPDLKRAFDEVVAGDAILSEKDRDGLTLAGWQEDERSVHFQY